MSGIWANQSDLTGRLTTGFLNQPSNELCLILWAIGNVKLSSSSNFKSASDQSDTGPPVMDHSPAGGTPLRNNSINIHSLLIKNFQECRARLGLSPSSTTRSAVLVLWTISTLSDTVLWQDTAFASASNFCCRASCQETRTSQTSRSAHRYTLRNFVPKIEEVHQSQAAFMMKAAEPADQRLATAFGR